MDEYGVWAVATNMSQLTIGTPLLAINGYSISYLDKLSTLPEHVAKQMASFELSTVDRQNSAASGMFKTFTELDIYYCISVSHINCLSGFCPLLFQLSNARD